MNSDSHDQTQVAENFYHEKVFKCKECDGIRSNKKAMKRHLKRSGHSGFTVDSGFPVLPGTSQEIPQPEVQVLPAGQKVGCHKCTRYFENKFTCQRHLKEQHGVKSVTELTCVPNTKKICPDCGK